MRVTQGYTAGTLQTDACVEPRPNAPLRESGALSTLLDELPVGVALLTSGGVVQAVNPAAASMLEGSSGGELAVALAQVVKRGPVPAAGVSEALLPTVRGEVRVLMAPAAGDGFLALLSSIGGTPGTRRTPRSSSRSRGSWWTRA